MGAAAKTTCRTLRRSEFGKQVFEVDVARFEFALRSRHIAYRDTEIRLGASDMDVLANYNALVLRDGSDAHALLRSLVGTNRLFHMPQDRWPEAVDPAMIARIAAAAARIVLHLARSG